MADYYVDENGRVRKKKKEDNSKSSISDRRVSTVKRDDDIAPVKKQETVTPERTWFSKGVFDDGYQFGDISKTILGTGKDIRENLYSGVIGMGEKAVDFGADVVGGVGKIFGADRFASDMEAFIKKDLIDEQKVARTMDNVTSVGVGLLNLMNIKDDTDDISVFGEKTDSLIQSAGQLGGTMALQSVGVPWWLTTGVTSYGGEVENAFKEGATYGEANLSAAISTGAEILSEKLFGGSGLGEKGLINLEPLTKGITNKLAKKLIEWGVVDTIAEGTEEVFSQFAGNLGSKLYKEESLKDILFSEEALDEYLESFVGGAVLGGGANVGKVSNSIKTGRDYRTDLTDNEQQVFDRVYEDRIYEAEKDGKKLSGRDKAKIYDEVLQDMEDGYISTDTIEEVLGGETYKSYRDTVDSEDSILKEYEELGNLTQPTLAQQTRYTELGQQVNDIRTQYKRNGLKTVLGQQVSEQVKSDRLSESYRQRALRGQTFQADVSQYEGDAAKVVQRAIDSGILNNTRRTHQLVDLVAKLSAERGVLFDFTNNAKLKESGFAVQGRIVNGFKTKDGITINIDSSKAFESTVGHEITHVLEGTELYSELQSAVIEYAKTKNDYTGRVKALTELYKGVQADIDSELTADLVGDYLFQDSDFVNNLSANHRNVFQKIYDEIKYLAKLVTAGSKEARQLEKVKKIFDEAFKQPVKKPKRENPFNKRYSGTDNGVQYSLKIKHTDGTVEELADARNLTNDQAVDYLRKAKSGALQRETYVPVRADTPQVIIDTLEQVNEQVENRSLVMQVRKAQQAMSSAKSGRRSEKYGTNVRGHALSAEQIVEIVNNLDDPSMVVYQTNRLDSNGNQLPNNVAVFVEYDNNGTEGVAVIEFDSSIDPKSIGTDFGETSYHTVVTVFEPDVERDGVEFDYAEELLSNPDNIELKIERKQPGGSVTGANQPNTSSELLSNGTNIPQNGNGVKYSLSAEQQEYFKDSVVRDENGNLKAMYHGTSKGGHTVFDTYGSNYGLFGSGSYFTDSKSIAESYTKKGKGNNPQVYETYLNIKNPMDMDAAADPSEWAKAFPDATFPESGTNEDFYRAMEQYFEDNEYPKWEASDEAVMALEDMGYDGITHIGGGRVDPNGERHQVYIAFHPEQIKNVDNTSPTTDPDIRFSLSMDTTLSDTAISANESLGFVPSDTMTAAKDVRERVAERLRGMKENGVAIPEDIKGSTAISNSSYDITEENTTICPRSLAAEAFTDAVSEYLGRPLTVEEQIYISQDLQGRSLTPECTYCYVATDRKAYRAFLGEYINQRDAVLQELKENPNADVSQSGDLYKKFLNGRKPTKPMYNRFTMWVNAYKNGTPMIEASHLANINKLMGDIKSEFGEELKPQIVDAMKYAQSASWAKKRVSYVAYDGHILKWKQSRIDKLNSHYGLRMYSFSDFHPAFVLENMQMITDAAVRGLKMLGYTKDTDFVEIFAPSGMNINISTFGFESSGNVYENNIIGANWEKAKALREQYPNVGITFVATNDNLVEWALAQDWIDVVIPYHLVRTGEAVAKAFNYTNYTAESSDTKDTGWQKGRDAKYIAPTEHNNDKATYLAALARNNLKPRFGRFVSKPNYMKLVNECRQPASVSKPVQPVFNEDAINTALSKLEANGYYQPVGGSVDRMYEIAAEVAENMTGGISPVSNSLSFEGEQHKRYGDRATFSEDVKLEQAPARESPVTTTVSNTESVAPVVKTTDTTNIQPTPHVGTPVEEMFPDNLVPAEQELEGLYQQRDELENEVRDMFNGSDFHAFEQVNAEYENVQSRIRELENAESGRFDSLTDADAPPEMEAPYDSDSENVPPADPFAERDMREVGNQKVKAYMYENPEVKPYFQEAAYGMLGDLHESTKGERWYNDELHYATGGEKGWFGTTRNTTDDIAELLDQWRYSYADIEKGLEAIIEDNGAENNAASKRIEFLLDQRLRNGYTDVTGRPIPANQDYIDLMRANQVNADRAEDLESFWANADSYAPVDSSAVDAPADIAPTLYTEEVIPGRKGVVDGQHTVFTTDHIRKSGQAAENTAPVMEVKPGKKAVDGQTEMYEDAAEDVRLTRKSLHESIITNIKSRFSSLGFDFDEVLKKAKDLSTFATVDNTPQRVMEKSLGYKAGQVLSDLTVNQVAQNETQGISWLNSFTDRKNGLLAQISRQYGIKPGSKESAAAQMYAEGFYVDDNGDIIKYGDSELAADFPDAMRRRDIKLLARDPRIRKIYDETLARINESRTRNAYPEIPRLDNYFLHFRAMEDTFSRLGLPFNPNDIRAKDLPTDLNGVTADLKPGQPYFASAKHRTGKRTSFDLLGGLERYLTSAKDQIYHIDDIQTLRALRNYVADTYGQAHGLENLDELTEEEAQERIQEVYGSHLSTFAKFLNEEANVLAGKTALIDRGLEGIIGRRGMTLLDTVNKQVGANMVGFNVSSSLTNFLSVAQGFAKTNKADFLRAFTQTVSNRIGSMFGRNDGFAENSSVMIRRKGADRFHRNLWQTMGDAGYALMSAVDEVSTEILARAKYNEFTRNGMDSQTAHYEADKWVSRLMGDRSLGQQPQLYNSKMLGMITKFQLEVRNQLDSQFYDTIQEANASNEHIQNGLARNARTAAKVAATFFKLAVGQHLFGKVFESVAGYNPAFDIISVLMTAFGYDDDEESEDTALDNIEQGFLELLGDMPYSSVLTGGRIPISSALPVEQFVTGKDQYGNEKSRWETLAEVAPYYLLPGGYSQGKKTVQGLGMFSDDHPVSGSYTDSGKLRFPVDDTLGSKVQAGIFGQWASGNARDYFDNERSALNEKQTQEFIDSGMEIQDYWSYRDGLKGLSTLAEKADYIFGLDLPIGTKNLLINNQTDRKDPIDLTDYGKYENFEEFDYAQQNPEKYAFLRENGLSYADYKGLDEDTKSAWSWAFSHQEEHNYLKENGVSPEDYSVSYFPNVNFEDESNDAYLWAMDNPESYTLSKAVTSDVTEYRQYAKELYDIKADKDESGKSISGSRKEKVIEYINNLNLDYGAKIVLFKSEYNADDTYNYEIIDYLNGRDDISAEEMATILKKLGFQVDSNGNITW